MSPICSDLDNIKNTRSGTGVLIFITDNKFARSFQVSIDSWPLHSRYPLGHFVRDLGAIGDRDTETEVHPFKPQNKYSS